jgi:predicted Zn finger-like uncharacterized protein
MSYTTRCPACGTTFRVVSDQLKISDGWVRCGHCSDVFDATLSLQPWPSTSGDPRDIVIVQPAGADELPGDSGPSPEPVSHSPEPPKGGSQLPVNAVNRDPDPGPDVPIAPPPLPEPEPPSTQVDEPVAAGWEDSDFTAELHRYARQARAEQAAGSTGDGYGRFQAPGALAAELTPATQPVRSAPPPSAPHEELSVPAQASALSELSVPPKPLPEAEASGDVQQEPGFVLQARRRAFWTSASVRTALGMLVLVLGGLLGLQWAIHDRNLVAARWPSLRPMLQAVCEPLGCSLAPVRRIEDVVIDSSTLQRKLGNFYAFDLVLRNRSDVPLAVPALELSLTDMRDQVISRRVFLADELPGLPEQLPPNESVSTSLRLSLSMGNEVSMAGYRALVFYP